MLAQYRQVCCRVRITLLAVEPGDETGIEMLRPGVRHLVQHPRLAHVPILTLAPVPILRSGALFSDGQHVALAAPIGGSRCCPRAGG
jgi:hypothetical protein